LGDWLADIVTGTPVTGPDHDVDTPQEEKPEEQPTAAAVEEDDPFVDKRPVYLLQHHPSQRNINKPDLKL
jgi:hypothetical protein